MRLAAAFICHVLPVGAAVAVNMAGVRRGILQAGTRRKLVLIARSGSGL
jgi:hypothetical protein